MVSLSFIAEHWISLIFGLISTGAVAYCRFFYKKFKQFEELEQEKNREEIEELINSKISPLENAQSTSSQNFIIIRDFYKFHLIELCKFHLDKGFMSSEEYAKLSEMWKVYEGLGGNS